MSLLIFCLIVVIVLALAVYAVRLLPLQAPFSAIIQVLLILVAIVAILSRSGLI
jgi:hypothetical protein